MPEGKANKGMMDIWVGKHSMRRNEKKHLFSILSHVASSPKVIQIHV
jgi:hypothetical protein